MAEFVEFVLDIREARDCSSTPLSQGGATQACPTSIPKVKQDIQEGWPTWATGDTLSK